MLLIVHGTLSIHLEIIHVRNKGMTDCCYSGQGADRDNHHYHVSFATPGLPADAPAAEHWRQVRDTVRLAVHSRFRAAVLRVLDRRYGAFIHDVGAWSRRGGLLAVFFYRWADDKRAVLRVFAVSFVVCILVATYSVLALTGVTGQSKSSISTTLGFITIGTTIGLYISPLATVARALRTKTSSSMPFTMGVANVVNTICWIMYSALVSNMFILAPNIAGLALGSTQLILTLVSIPEKEFNRKIKTPAEINHPKTQTSQRTTL